MAVRIGTNPVAIAAANSLGRSVRSANDSLLKLSSGKNFVRIGDDPAGHSIASKLNAQVRSIQASQKNAQQAVSFVQVAEGALNEQNNILIRTRELAIQAASDTVSDVEREFLNKEFTLLVKEFDRIAKTTNFGEKRLLIGDDQEYQFQVGPGKSAENQIKFELKTDTTASTVGVDGLSIGDQDDALDSLENIDEGLYKINEARSEFGAIQSRLERANDFLLVQEENIDAARSNIEDVDVARETARLAHASIQQQIGVAVSAQANIHPKAAQALISVI